MERAVATMERCEHCGALFLDAERNLVLAHLTDRWGHWHEWLCFRCVDELATEMHAGASDVERLSVWGATRFEIDTA